MVDQAFAASEMGKSMDADLLPELSGETWVASALIEEFMADLLQVVSKVDLITASRQDATLATVREWIQSEATPESDGLVERFNRTLLMMLAMFAGEHKDDWHDFLPPCA